MNYQYILNDWILKKDCFGIVTTVLGRITATYIFLELFRLCFFFFPVLVSIWDYLLTTSLGTKTQQMLKGVPSNNIL